MDPGDKKVKKMNKIEEYYNKFNEEKRLNSRHGQIEYRITMKCADAGIEGHEPGKY